MRRVLTALLLALMTAVLSADTFLCPDGCTDEALAPSSDVECLVCQRGIEPATARVSDPVRASRPALPRAPFVAILPELTSDIDHPPRA